MARKNTVAGIGSWTNPKSKAKPKQTTTKNTYTIAGGSGASSSSNRPPSWIGNPTNTTKLPNLANFTDLSKSSPTDFTKQFVPMEDNTLNFYKGLDNLDLSPPPPQQPQPQQPMPQVTPYADPYQNALTQAIGNIQNFKYQPYNPNNDAALKAAQEQAMGEVRKDMARRGRVFDTFAATKEQEAAQGLIPSYYQADMRRQQMEQGNLMNQLAALQGLSNTGYNRAMADRQFENLLGQQQFQQDVTSAPLTGEFRGEQTERQKRFEQEQMETQEIADYGTVLSDKMREYKRIYDTLPQEVIRQYETLSNQEGGYATTLNRLYREDPNSQLIPILESMRAQKILADPELLNMYGKEYGLKTGRISQMAEASVHKETLEKLELMKAELVNEKVKNDITKIQEEVLRLEADTRLKDAKTVEAEWDGLSSQIEALSLPSFLQAELQSEIELGKQRAMSAFASEQTGLLRQEQIEREPLEREKLSSQIAENRANVGVLGARRENIEQSTRAKAQDMELKKAKEEAKGTTTNPYDKWIGRAYGEDKYKEFETDPILGKKTVKDVGRRIIPEDEKLDVASKLVEYAESAEDDKDLEQIMDAAYNWGLVDYMEQLQRGESTEGTIRRRENTNAPYNPNAPGTKFPGLGLDF